MRFEEYQKIDAVNFSRLKLFEHSPAAFLRGYTEQTETMAQGLAVHTATLEPDIFEEEYVRQPDEITTRRGKVWDAFEAKNSSQMILRGAQWDGALAVARMVWGHERASALLTECPSRETVITATIRDVPVKCRLDFFGDRFAGDLKTARDISRRGWQSAVMRYGYLAQAAFYLDILEASGRGEKTWKWIAAQECDDVAVIAAPDDAIEFGRVLYHGWLDRYIECMSSGKFPGVDGGGELVFELPSWAKSADGDDVEFDVEVDE